MRHALLLFAVVIAVSTSARAQTTPPTGWTCEPTFFGADDGCDCGCGVQDTDCATNTIDVCKYDQCPADGAGAAQSPSASDPTQCVANTCGDGVKAGEEACDDGNATDADGCTACAEDDHFNCAEGGSLTTTCNAVPAEWTCSASFYGGGPNDGCDCGCGAIDADCPPNATISDCLEFSNGCAEGQVVNPADITGCIAEGEGEGDVAGEGEGDAAEGEGDAGGEGEGDGSGRDTPDPQPKAAASCVAVGGSHADWAAAAALLALSAVVGRRRRR